jgi:hypothetical protein
LKKVLLKRKKRLAEFLSWAPDKQVPDAGFSKRVRTSAEVPKEIDSQKTPANNTAHELAAWGSTQQNGWPLHLEGIYGKGKKL